MLLGFLKRQSEETSGPSELTSPFDSIREFDEDGNEFWSARNMMPFLGYGKKWQNFAEVVRRAKEACRTSGYDPAEHFTDTSKTILGGNGALLTVPDVHMDRFACYHLALAGDPSKQGVADARSYFVIKARRQEKREAEERQAQKIGKTASSAQKKNGLDVHYGLARQDAVDISKIIAEIFCRIFNGDRRMIAGAHNAIYQALTGLTASQLQAKYGFKDTPLNHLETALLALRNSMGALIAQGVNDGTITPDNAYEMVQAMARALLAVPLALYKRIEISSSLSPTGQTLLGIRPAIANQSHRALS
jgi:hypothetical protein